MEKNLGYKTTVTYAKGVGSSYCIYESSDIPDIIKRCFKQGRTEEISRIRLIPAENKE